MRTKARSARLPRKLLRGQKLLDGISGEEIYQRDSSTRYQRDMWMHKKNYDELTTQQMEDMLLTTIAGANLTYQNGQGNEVPSYSNLPFFQNDAAAEAQGYVLGMPYNGPDGFTHVGDNPGVLNQVYDDSGNAIQDDSGNYVAS